MISITCVITFFMGRSEMTPTFLLVAFRTCLFQIAQKSDSLLFVSSSAPTIHKNMLGVAKDMFWRFRRLDLTEDAWRQS